VDFISTGGGAMLEFIATKGRLPGLRPLERRR
jgi:3-phosphoglycerate kinase